jgi:hypothetical protein
MTQSTQAEPTLRRRGPELGVALFLLALGGLVIWDSFRVGIGWADDGPQSGYFPFYIGCLLSASSAFTVVRTLLTWRAHEEEFATHDELASVMLMLFPLVIYIVCVVEIGLYLPSIVLIAFFMRRHGNYGWLRSLAVPLLTMALFYLIFERWFLVPLPKGPVEALLGL